jgi:hypothetical protein
LLGQGDGVNSYGVWGYASHRSGYNIGVFGNSDSPIGIGVAGVGILDGIGVYGLGGTGVQGESDIGIGVEGRATPLNGSGTGVLAHAQSPGATALRAQHASGGQALRVQGQAAFDRSGTVTISYPAALATVAVPGSIGPSSFALAVLQTNLPGVYVTAAVLDPPSSGSGRLTIYLNKAPANRLHAPGVVVGWFVVN